MIPDPRFGPTFREPGTEGLELFPMNSAETHFCKLVMRRLDEGEQVVDQLVDVVVEVVEQIVGENVDDGVIGIRNF